MKFNPQIHQRHSTRLKSYDYSSAGGYFVTICAYQKEHLFGNIINGQMVSSAIGEIPEKPYVNIKFEKMQGSDGNVKDIVSTHVGKIPYEIQLKFVKKKKIKKERIGFVRNHELLQAFEQK